MSANVTSAVPGRRKPNTRALIIAGAVVVLFVAMALSTKVVKIGSSAADVPGTFTPETFGAEQFPKIQAAVENRAVDAATFASALAKSHAAAAKQYGISASQGTEIPVKFTGTVGKGDFGTYDVAVAGVPKSVMLQVQTGPAISGTDLRDATGAISFGQFTNQIEYQNAGAALNKQMKKDVLAKLDTSNLTGKTIDVVGVFLLSDSTTWLVTPVKLDVK